MEIVRKKTEGVDEFCRVTYEFNKDEKMIAFEYGTDGARTRMTMNPSVSKISLDIPENVEEVDGDTFAWSFLGALFSMAFSQGESQDGGQLFHIIY